MGAFARLALSRSLKQQRLQCQRIQNVFSSPFFARSYSQPPIPSSSSSESETYNGPDTFFPNLMSPFPIIDAHEVQEFPPTKRVPHHSRVIVRNDGISLGEYQRLYDFGGDEAAEAEYFGQDKLSLEEDEEGGNSALLTDLPFDKKELSKFYRFPLVYRRITQQTGKGKIHRQYYLIIVGNGDGLVGLGEGKDGEAPRAIEKAFAQAVRNMDYVERFEKRTIWTEMRSKMGGTQIILRPRPVGFGLSCNPNIHQILKAAGIKDASAKVWGSRNPINVIKTTLRMIQAGNAPLAMGNGIGGKGRKLDRGAGVRGKFDVERERGRKLIDLRTW